MKKIRNYLSKIRKKLGLRALLVSALLLILSIGVARIFQKPTSVPAITEAEPQAVRAILFGSNAVSQKAVGTITNKGSVTLVAQSAGPVSQLTLKEGQTVGKGAVIMAQSSAYGTGTAASVQRQIASRNFDLAQENAQNTVEVVAKNRALAEQNRDNTEELRKITEKSIDEIKSVIATTEQVIAQIESDITSEQQGANNPAVIQGLRQTLISYKGVVNSNRSALRSAEYSVNTDNPPTDIAKISKDLVFTTTELQLKSAEINKDIAALNLKLAGIHEASTRVVAPFGGTIEKIYVSKGQYLNPGTPVAKISGLPHFVLSVPIAAQLSTLIDSEQALNVHVGSESIQVPITHISSTPTQGQLYEITAYIPENLIPGLLDQSTLPVTVPLYQVSGTDGNRFLPIEAVYITATESFVYVIKDDKATKQVVELGEIQGGVIEVTKGLADDAVVILDRTVIEGRTVKGEIISAPTTDQTERG